jgi:basic membrane protein A and related proteins
MRTKWRVQTIATLVLIGSFATACSGGGNPCEVSEESANPDGVSVGIAFDVGGIGDKSFNDAAKAGFDQAVDEGLVSEASCLEPDESGSNRDENLLALADDGFDLILGIGFAFSPAVNENAGNYPDQQFAVIDGYATCPPDICSDIPNPAPPNVLDLTFEEQEGSFLVGVAAALHAQSESCDTVGFLGGQTGFLIGKFEAGYTNGVAAIDPGMNVLVEYIGDSTAAFNDAVSGENLSTKMYDEGACVIYHAAGASGAGLFTAAVKADKIAIGVDSDQYQLVSAEQQPLVLTSMLKRVDTAVYDAIRQAGDGSFEGGTAQVFGIAEDGISYSTANTELMTQDIIDQVEDYKAQIVDGSLVPSCDPANLDVGCGEEA